MPSLARRVTSPIGCTARPAAGSAAPDGEDDLRLGEGEAVADADARSAAERQIGEALTLGDLSGAKRPGSNRSGSGQSLGLRWVA